MALVVAFPGLTSPGAEDKVMLDEAEVMKVFENQSSGADDGDLMQGLEPPPASGAEDPTRDVLDAIKAD